MGTQLRRMRDHLVLALIGVGMDWVIFRLCLAYVATCMRAEFSWYCDVSALAVITKFPRTVHLTADTCTWECVREPSSPLLIVSHTVAGDGLLPICA